MCEHSDRHWPSFDEMKNSKTKIIYKRAFLLLWNPWQFDIYSIFAVSAILASIVFEKSNNNNWICNLHLPWPRAAEARTDSRSATLFNSNMVPHLQLQLICLWSSTDFNLITISVDSSVKADVAASGVSDGAELLLLAHVRGVAELETGAQAF